MAAQILTNSLTKILVVGIIHQKMDILDKINILLGQYDYVIVNGGLDYSKFDKIKQIFQNPKMIYCIGRNDLLISANENTNEEIKSWIDSRPNIVIAEFSTRPIMIIDGGIPKGTRQRINLLDNIELSFVSYIDGKPWHQSYGGKWGYVISNNPLSEKPPQYYSHSLQIGNQKVGQVYAQEVDEIGLKRLIYL